MPGERHHEKLIFGSFNRETVIAPLEIQKRIEEILEGASIGEGQTCYYHTE